MAAQILVIDDEPQFERLVLQRMRRPIREGLYEFRFATDGIEALELLRQGTEIDMVLTDINMPRMDGLTLLGEIRKDFPVLKTVVVSAYGDMKNIRTAMNLGAFDFLTKPIDFNDLKITIDKTLQEVKLIQQAEAAKALVEKNKRLEELDQLKTKFFTNISHEFRTPLTVISGMSKQIEEKPERWFSKGLQMIQHNTQDLLDLVNQILDLSRLEAGKMPLKLSQGNVLLLMSYLHEYFTPVADAKNIQLHSLMDEQELIMDFDGEKLHRILSNLLGNALKFTPENGHVYLIVNTQQHQLTIQVKDTGPGISEEAIPHLFDRFFQASNGADQQLPGSGIGLSLVKELTELMDGSISVSSQLGKGTTFTIQLPIQRESPIPIDAEKLKEEVFKSSLPEDLPYTEAVEIDTNHPLLLIVEDNPDIASYLTSCLEDQYQLIFAQDGAEGIEKAIEHIPDLMISDVMMPKKDGFELCEVLKNDERTNHIPIVLLTAKADVASRVSGLSKGADAYLAKPFEKEELLVRLKMLFELRHKLQLRYSGQTSDQATEVQIETTEDPFMLKLRRTVIDNIEDEGFGTAELCRALGMSRTQLYRKIKALSGKSTSNFVRSIRLHKAKELLVSSRLNISQIAYEVGFRDPKYFSRTYTREFGKSPKAERQ
ncbi:MAG: response regulator [Bacteroidota bacterium]